MLAIIRSLSYQLSLVHHHISWHYLTSVSAVISSAICPSLGQLFISLSLADYYPCPHSSASLTRHFSQILKYFFLVESQSDLHGIRGRAGLSNHDQNEIFENCFENISAMKARIFMKFYVVVNHYLVSLSKNFMKLVRK